MEYNGEGVEALVSIIDEIENSNLFTADKKLPNLLKCLAYYDEFKTVLAVCNQGFDYASEKNKAFQNIGGTQVLRLPKNGKQFVAFISNLLIDADAGSLDLYSLADTYFHAENGKSTLEKFCTEVLEPFKYALVKFTVEGFDDDNSSLRQIEFVSGGLKKQTEHLLIELANSIREAKISEESRAEFIIMLEGLAAALDSRDALMIRAVWIGLQKALKSAKLAYREIEKTEEIFKLYLVIK